MVKRWENWNGNNLSSTDSETAGNFFDTGHFPSQVEVGLEFMAAGVQKLQLSHYVAKRL